MTRAYFKAIAFFLALALAVPARAAFVADPAALYEQMKDAYAKGEAAGWNYRSQEIYLASILNAGRAYSLQHPEMAAYGELAGLTVQIGGALHYNPLTNHDGAVWWIAEAAEYVKQHSEDPSAIAQAQAMLLRVNSEDDPEQLARYADEDAAANVRTYPGDVDAMLQQVEADWRGWLLTRDPAWRSLALKRSADPSFPVAHLPTNWGNELIAAANAAAPGQDGYTADDAKNAATLIARIRAVDPIRVIASVTAVPHDVYLSTLAPADEYFGHREMSVLEIQNRLKHINFMLDYNYGNRESAETAGVADSIDSMQKIYPRDRDLPMLLYWCYTTAQRMDDAVAKKTAAHLKAVLTVEYQDSPQARKLLTGTS
ncbi:MAG: hypothetical protein JOY98_03675, partial [Candidatus Eremiobacteraeota bacterium]|nr:hypothetical protein [Candidatus Eremiobacteraeota bacterium]